MALMDPGFHRLYARRLAWRYRLLLALGLALLGLRYPGLALASPLALLLPARPFEGRALRAIARKSLAYPTALAYGEERLWQEARKVRVEPPPFPTGLLLAYLLVLLLALVPWKPLEGERPRPGHPPAPEAPPSGAEKGSAREASPAEEAPGPGKAPPREAAAPGAEGPGGKDGAQAPRKEPLGPGKGQEGPPSKAGRTAPAGNPAQGPAGKSPGGLQGKAPGEGPTPPAAPGKTGNAGSVNPEATTPLLAPGKSPSGPEAGLLSPGGEGGAGDLPAPWPGGRPPEGVRRGAEVYLERTPLPPEARELLRRYFGLEGAPAPPSP